MTWDLEQLRHSQTCPLCKQPMPLAKESHKPFQFEGKVICEHHMVWHCGPCMATTWNGPFDDWECPEHSPQPIDLED